MASDRPVSPRPDKSDDRRVRPAERVLHGRGERGVWKTTDFWRTWTPIFDDQPTGSIGAIAVSPSDPNIVYVGDGLDKSTDAGPTWTHLGLRDGQALDTLLARWTALKTEARSLGVTPRRAVAGIEAGFS